MPDIFVNNKDKEIVHKEDKKDEGDKSTNLYIFSSLVQRPHDISFKDQDRDEQIVLFARRHFFTNIQWILITIALFFIPPFLSVFNIDFSIFPQRYFIVSTIFYYLLLATYVFINFITWFYNISFVTNTRIVDVDFSGVIYKNVAETKLSQIEDVNYDQTGVFATFFNYGDVLAQTPGEQKNFDFTAVPKPGEIAHTIADLLGGKNARF